jgi:hypothetical protein
LGGWGIGGGGMVNILLNGQIRMLRVSQPCILNENAAHVH